MSFPQAKKKWGQHFLASQKVISKIVGDSPTSDEQSAWPSAWDSLIEVGPGPAILTKDLVKHQKPFFAFEKDADFADLLSEHLPQTQIVFTDALEFDWGTFFKTQQFHYSWLVSNLPYNVSVPLTLLFWKIPEIKKMTLMYQKEVAEKFLPPQKASSLNSLQWLSHLYFEVKKLIDAPAGAFVPPPKVQSQVLTFVRKRSPSFDLQEFSQLEKFARLAFSTPRKQLFGILKAGFESSIIQVAFDKLDISLQIRAEALTVEEMTQLYVTLKSQAHHGH